MVGKRNLDALLDEGKNLTPEYLDILENSKREIEGFQKFIQIFNNSK